MSTLLLAVDARVSTYVEKKNILYFIIIETKTLLFDNLTLWQTYVRQPPLLQSVENQQKASSPHSCRHCYNYCLLEDPHSFTNVILVVELSGRVPPCGDDRCLVSLSTLDTNNLGAFPNNDLRPSAFKCPQYVKTSS
ncbi:hypothetical protein CEXT_312911 [Caerostris extrusa]|uniref:Uncharacterized protein n=1 Tax=Caerostris extrusa TaxID=172846 RepID=A0AAV4S891_CAEEX|nr:hypothetical protein CEXT_312911 [Caerostris extrusa]